MNPKLSLTIRWAAGVVGVAALVWGGLIAAFAGQPIPLIVVGILLILLAIVGAEWEEIAAKFGDNEMRVKRRIETKVEAASVALTSMTRAVKESPEIPDETRRRITELSLQAFSKLREIESSTYVPKRNQQRDIVVVPIDNAKFKVVVSGIESTKWHVQQALTVEYRGEVFTATLNEAPNEEQTLVFPDDFTKDTESDFLQISWNQRSAFDEDPVTVVKQMMLYPFRDTSAN